MDDGYAFGIEEEYFLADRESGRSADEEQSDRFHASAVADLALAEHELLKSQVEFAAGPEDDGAVTCDKLRTARQDLSRVAHGHGLVLFAAGSHPLGSFERQRTTDKTRYRQLEAQFGLIAHRSMCCAMHVHVEVPATLDRVRMMNRLVPFLPLLLALSTSSPFWSGEAAGLKSMRLAVFSEWPRMGLPELFADEAEFDDLVTRLVEAGNMEHASFLWWLIRPSNKFPTIELRICDSCTRVEDAVAIASLYRCLVRAVARQPETHTGAVQRAIAAENIWQAQRCGLQARFLEAQTDAVVTVREALETVLALTSEDARALGCVDWVDRTRAIADAGSSSDRQLDVFSRAQAAGSSPNEALRAVVAHLAVETTA